MAAGDRRLERVGADRAEVERPTEVAAGGGDEAGVPAGAVLVCEQDEISVSVTPGGFPRLVELHQREESEHLGVVVDHLGEQPPEAERLVAHVRPLQVGSPGRRVPLVEDQVDDVEHGRQPARPLIWWRDGKTDAGVGQRAFGPDETLSDRRVGL